MKYSYCQWAITICMALMLSIFPMFGLVTMVTSIPSGKIAFVSDRDGHNEIFLMNANGSAQRRLTYSDSDHESLYPSWSPDGNQILYTYNKLGKAECDSQLYIMNIDGTNAHSITQGRYCEHNAVWSPDGKHIAFVALGEEADCINPCLYEMDVSSGKLKMLRGGMNVATPAYSPNGKYLVFTFWGSGLPQLASIEFTPEHEVVSVNVRLTDVDIDYRTGNQHLMDHADGSPAWLPDSRQIVFLSTRKPRKDEENCNGQWTCIYIMDVITGQTKSLILKHEIDYSESFDFRQHLSWSPDGQHLALSVQSAQYQNNTSIWIMNLDGNIQRLTDEKANDFQPAWQPISISTN